MKRIFSILVIVMLVSVALLGCQGSQCGDDECSKEAVSE